MPVSHDKAEGDASEPKGLIDVSEEDWEKAKLFFKSHPDQTKLQKKSNSINCSFIKVDDVIYAKKTGEALGQGAFGKVKLVQTESGDCYAVKIEGRGLRGKKDTEFKVLEKLGELHGEAQRIYGKHFLQAYAKTKLYTIINLKSGEELLDKLYYPSQEKKELLRHDVIDEEKIIYAIRCAEAIQSLHTHFIIHGDIKPENFMVNKKDEFIMIAAIDFGFSIVTENGFKEISLKNEYNQALARGTAGYMAPEARWGKYSFATDVHALGHLFLNDLELTLEPSAAAIVETMKDENPKHRPHLDAVIPKLYESLKCLKNVSPLAQIMIDNYNYNKHFKCTAETLTKEYLLAKKITSKGNLNQYKRSFQKSFGKVMLGTEEVRMRQIEGIADAINYLNSLGDVNTEEKVLALYGVYLKTANDITQAGHAYKSDLKKVCDMKVKEIEIDYQDCIAQSTLNTNSFIELGNNILNRKIDVLDSDILGPLKEKDNKKIDASRRRK